MVIPWKSKSRASILSRFGSKRDFVSIDPGGKGAAVIWVDMEPVASCAFHQYSGYAEMELLLAKHSIGFGIIEDAYVGKSQRAAITLGHWRGWALRCVEHGVRTKQKASLTMLLVSPSTWQAALPRDGLPPGQPWDGDAKKEKTMQIYEESCRLYPWAFNVQAPSVEKDAVGSAHGIGAWWRKEVADGCA